MPILHHGPESDQSPPAERRHDPVILDAGRHGAWIECSCGWLSGTYRAIHGAHLQFGRHLLARRNDGAV